jgi:hypothetical protein
MNYSAASWGTVHGANDFDSRHPRTFLSGVQIQTRLDSRLKHAAMTDFERGKPWKLIFNKGFF